MKKQADRASWFEGAAVYSWIEGQLTLSPEPTRCSRDHWPYALGTDFGLKRTLVPLVLTLSTVLVTIVLLDLWLYNS
ncbi:hypothetical protein Tco_0728974 [Tanacetum coccineum]|uniref:Uncharacterized protein n=1 Tax=Tanacetum coccineum TaxID=301880 RepID=A0ABQ4YMP5_9ASTR